MKLTKHLVKSILQNFNNYELKLTVLELINIIIKFAGVVNEIWKKVNGIKQVITLW